MEQIVLSIEEIQRTKLFLQYAHPKVSYIINDNIIQVNIMSYSVYQRQQKTLYPKSGIFCTNNFLNLLISSQPIIIEGRSLICYVRTRFDKIK